MADCIVGVVVLETHKDERRGRALDRENQSVYKGLEGEWIRKVSSRSKRSKEMNELINGWMNGSHGIAA